MRINSSLNITEQQKLGEVWNHEPGGFRGLQWSIAVICQLVLFSIRLDFTGSSSSGICSGVCMYSGGGGSGIPSLRGSFIRPLVLVEDVVQKSSGTFCLLIILPIIKHWACTSDSGLGITGMCRQSLALRTHSPVAERNSETVMTMCAQQAASTPKMPLQANPSGP